MKISDQNLLRTVFRLRGNFAQGRSSGRKVFDGVEVVPFKNDAEASVSISADFEHNWAFRAWPSDVRNQKGINERKNVPNLIRLFEEYSMPITWATVGHLFLESCERGGGGQAHPNMPRPSINGRFIGDWYMHDPCTNLRQDPLWYAPDLIQNIIDSNVPHEIGTHTFSHFDFRLKYSSKDLVQREIEECRRVMEPFSVQPKSLVFPHNETEYSYAKQLFDLDVIALRHRDPKVRLSYPDRLESGNYRIYESMNLRSTRRYDYVDKVKIFVEEAARHRAAYHIFFHPSDPAELFENEFRRIVKYFHEQRKKGQIWVATMMELAAYCEARECVRIKVVKRKVQLDVMMESSLNRVKFGDPEISLSIPGTVAPRKALVEKDGDIQELSSTSLYVDQQRQRVLVNVPASSKMVRLVF
jgi:peptidoglycan/xylan/chitin deacetylase (PgdA/CDA1 family)